MGYKSYETTGKKVALYNGYTSKWFYFLPRPRHRRGLQHGGVDNFFFTFYSYETKRHNLGNNTPIRRMQRT